MKKLTLSLVPWRERGRSRCRVCGGAECWGQHGYWGACSNPERPADSAAQAEPTLTHVPQHLFLGISLVTVLDLAGSLAQTAAAGKHVHPCVKRERKQHGSNVLQPVRHCQLPSS